jgi:hypothetical protein
MHVHEMHQPNHASNAWYGQGAHQLLIIVGEQKNLEKRDLPTSKKTIYGCVLARAKRTGKI